MMKIKSNCIEIDSKKVEFEYKIKDVIDIDGMLIILFEVPKNKICNDNVVAIDKNGNEVWRITELEHAYEDSPFMDVYITNSELWLGNWDGNEYRVNPKTGDVLEKRFTK